VDFWLFIVHNPILRCFSRKACSVSSVPGKRLVVFAASSSYFSAISSALSRMLLSVLCGLLLFLR
jgi:hypothetical protein